MRRLVCIAMCVSGCGETGLERVSFPIHGAGTTETTFDSDAWTVTLEQADVGFGPIYFCATSFADVDVCPQAEAEWLGTATVDALDGAPSMLGDVSAVTTTVRSAMFDYGRTWLLRDSRPRGNQGAPSGRSAVFLVRAARGPTEIEVRAEVDVDAPSAGRSAVIGALVGEHEITGDEALTVRFDPSAWWRRVDFDRIAANDDGDGLVTLAPGDPDYEALVIAMTAGTLPAFEWAGGL